MINLPDMNRIKIFYFVYKLGSSVAASRQLNLTQPAVSQQLKKLEEELKAQLFVRMHKQLVPTAAGIHLYRLIAPLFEKLISEIGTIRLPHDRPSGKLRIGAPREFGKEYLPRFCQRFRSIYPDVTFELKLKEAVPLLSMLQKGELDFALVDVYYEPGELPGFPFVFSMEPLLREEMMLVSSKGYYHREINGDHSLNNLIGKDFVTDEDDPSILDLWFRHHFNKLPESLSVVMTLDTHEALLNSLRLGMGLGVATAHLIWKEIQRGDLVAITTAKKNMVNMISLVQLLDKIPTLTEKVFREFLLQEVQQHEVTGWFQCISD
ncbi:MAG TPA: LysR family transcriptional regulator [Pelovirga sp.]|nr:LysR family transcriptional regulator [Pelovirga sp.]